MPGRVAFGGSELRCPRHRGEWSTALAAELLTGIVRRSAGRAYDRETGSALPAESLARGILALTRGTLHRSASRGRRVAMGANSSTGIVALDSRPPSE